MTSDALRAFDARMMGIALTMAQRGNGQCAPNPAVGAVIADHESGEVIARATTAAGGRPHAETRAISQAGDRARGASIYVSLEPCSHQGLTGPCADAIVSAGLRRALVAIEDPDPRVAGRGLDRLRAAGIEVVRGIGAERARWITRGHVVRVTERRPLTTLKLALDAEGNIAPGTGVGPRWVTGPLARAHGALLRAEHDAILVGSGTVRADNPNLTCRLPGLEGRSPVRIVVSRSLDVALDSTLIRTARDVPLWVIGGLAPPPGRQEALEAAGAVVIGVTEVQGRLWLPAVMEEIVARGITRLLVEGGPHIWRAFADVALVDEVVLFMAGARDEARARGALAKMLGLAEFRLVEMRSVEPDSMWRFRSSLK
jgi:diaminohydroxyphosphoribosylaminopyrimidine deaminase/5-amino-6-(5-phosphoribosylamino)uracil reductase